jgi:putative ABC transport system ATP-binding protein
MITIKNLKKTYIMGKVYVHALRGISLDIKKGEFVSIMGASGSGKSTLLHIMGLIDEPTEGKVFIEGVDTFSLSHKKRTEFRLHEFGFIFQEYALMRELTAFENVYLPAMMNPDEAKYKKRAQRLLEDVGLGERLHHLPSEMSGGEQQRVAVARALINYPKIIYADEPTANLDWKKSLEIVGLLRKLNKKYKQTIVMVTHERSLGKKADRTIWLRDGLITKKPYQ